jgi:YidC/Oxa1 family membrane protein insertase
MTDQKNMLLAIVLSAIVLIAWQIFFGLPHMQQQQQKQQQQQTQSPVAPPGTPTAQPSPTTTPGQTTPAPTVAPGVAMSREAAIAASARVRIETPRLTGSINLKGGRIDDLLLTQYRETVNPTSPPVTLLSPSGAPMPFYAEFGWVAAAGNTMPLPNSETVWRQQGAGTLGVGRPITLIHDNGQGLQFRRTIAVDDKYMFTVRDEVVNKGAEATTIYPYALISRHGHPRLEGFYILHEGLVGVFGEQGLKEVGYAAIEKEKQMSFKATTPGSASPTNTGRQRWCRTTMRPFKRAFRAARAARSRPIRPNICSIP